MTKQTQQIVDEIEKVFTPGGVEITGIFLTFEGQRRRDDPHPERPMSIIDNLPDGVLPEIEADPDWKETSENALAYFKANGLTHKIVEYNPPLELEDRLVFSDWVLFDADGNQAE